MFLLSLFVAGVLATMSSRAISENKVTTNENSRSDGMMMAVLDENGRRKIVQATQNAQHPRFSESVFDSPEIKTGWLRGKRVYFFVRDGWAIVDGDIAIGRADDLINNRQMESITFAQHQYMWLKVGSVFQIPYIVTSGNANITTAINYFNTTFSGIIQWVPRTTETDYVDINLNPSDLSGSGFSALGRAGGLQQLGGAINMSVGTALHEMGHAVGLLHEQQRSDRNTYIEFHPENMSNSARWTSGQLTDYFQLISNQQDVGLYDYASIMHYLWNTFAKNDGVVLESIPAGIQIARYFPNNMTGDYSEGDIDAIKRLYDAAPTAITITSNPPGLQVIVDGMTITTPQTFNWTMGSMHTLSVPSGGQTLGNKAYVYGRWNDNAAATHTITVTPGDGRRVSPTNKPAVTVYCGNFINLIKFTQGVFPAGTGSMTAMPAPQSYTGLTGLYYVARQPVTLQATPNAGQNFYAWFNTPVFSFSRNPQTFRWDTNIAEVNTTAGFTDQPVYTFTSNVPDRRIWVYVDGAFRYGPANFSPAYDGAAWNAGNMHTVNTDSSQFPFDFATRHQFQSWSDGGAQSHSITLPATNTTYTANFSTQFNTRVETPCGGTPTISPASADGFYNAGTVLTVSQTPFAGYVFTRWREDLSGTTSPQMVTLNDELWAVADYNVNSTPLTITSLNPFAAIVGGAGFTLTIFGTGFTPDRTFVNVNNQYRPHTFISSTQITVPVMSSDITTLGGIPILVQNFPNPNPASCGYFLIRTLPVRSSGPTASLAEISGEIATSSGESVGKVNLTLTSIDGSETFETTTNRKGRFRFTNAPVGVDYILTPSRKGYSFYPSNLFFTHTGERPMTNFIALPNYKAESRSVARDRK
jgi:hypothetical protein